MNNSQDLITATITDMMNFINNLRCIQCDHYVQSMWSAYDGKMYCQECWDMNRAEEERLRLEEIAKLKKRLFELES